MRLIVTFLLLTLTLLAGSPSWAVARVAASGGAWVQDDGTASALQRGGKTLQQAVAQVRRQYPGGKIVSAETRGDTHVIKVLTADGTVRTVRIPAR